MQNLQQSQKGKAGLNKSFMRSLLCLSVAAACSQANAQQSEGFQSVEEGMEVVEVRGIRASMAESLAVKRMSNAVVEAITAEDIGKFPDKNIADSLQRVPGIIIQRDGGEGATVSIRGLNSDLTLTQLNGNFIASSPGKPSRSFDYKLLPSSMIGRVEVFKTPEARLDEGGVGGSVILHSRKPLEMDANSGIINIESTYADVTEDHEPQFAGLYSWKNEDETFGILAGYTKQDRTNRTLSGDMYYSMYTADPEDRANGTAQAVDANGNPVDDAYYWNTVTDASGKQYEGYWLPRGLRTGVVKEDREREGIQISSQWRPTDRIELGVNYFGFTLGQNRTMSYVDMPEWHYRPDRLVGMTVDETNSIITGADFSATASGNEVALEFPWYRGGYQRIENSSDTVDLNFNYLGDSFSAKFVVGNTKAEGGPTEDWKVAYKSHRSEARLDANGNVMTDADGNTLYNHNNASQTAGWSLTDDTISMYLDPDTLTNIKNGLGGTPDRGSISSGWEQSELEETYAQLDLDFDVDWGPVNRLRTGLKYRNTELQRFTGDTLWWTPGLSPDEVANLEEGDTYDNDTNGPGVPAFKDVINDNPEDNIIGGFNINQMPTINWDKYREIVRSNYQDYYWEKQIYDYSIEEDISAAYVQADFDHNSLRGNLGLRYVRTERATLSNEINEYFLDYYDDVTGEELPEDVRQYEVINPVTVEKTETHLLPSLNLVWDASDNLVVRAAAAKTIARPDYFELGREEALAYTSEKWAEDRGEFGDTEGFEGRGGNKNLDSFESVQFDLSVEYYYGEGSALGMALFHKDIDNFIVPMQISYSRYFDGEPGVVEAGDIIISPYNTWANGSNAKSKGVEVFFQHNFDSGFGVYGNYTYNDTNQADVSFNGQKIGESVLVGSAEYQYNLSAFYENDSFSVRASYNKRGDVVLGKVNGLDEIQDAYDQVDLNASYSINEALSLQASVINLTESESKSYLGDDSKARLYNASYAGRRFYVGLNYNF